jgi:GH24 family phage-related lysozyme (muramidase)
MLRLPEFRKLLKVPEVKENIEAEAGKPGMMSAPFREPQAVPLKTGADDLPSVRNNSEFLDDLRKFEGFEPKVYDDGAGNLSIGYGSNMEVKDSVDELQKMGYDIDALLKKTQSLSQEDAEKLLQKQLETRENSFDNIRKQNFPQSNITDNEKMALLSHFYNRESLMGPGTRLRKALQTNDDFAAARELLIGSNPKNKVGVQRRREAEALTFLGDRFQEFYDQLSDKDKKILKEKRKGFKKEHFDEIADKIFKD